MNNPPGLSSFFGQRMENVLVFGKTRLVTLLFHQTDSPDQSIKFLLLDANLFRKLYPDFKLLPPYHTIRNIVCVCLLRINWIKAEDVRK